MTIRCVITDDEPIARKGLQRYVEKISSLELVATCEDALSLNAFLKNNEVDLLFLDIEMPYLNGIEFLQSITNPPKVIFTTAYEKYAIKGYELEVLDYLLKPISFDRFLKAVNKAEIILKKEKEKSSDEFFIKVDGSHIRLSWNNILFIEGLENYITIYTLTEKYITHLTLKTVMSNMPGCFLQVHKSTIVNTDYISGITGNTLLIEKYQIIISRSLKENVLEKVLQNKILKKDK